MTKKTLEEKLAEHRAKKEAAKKRGRKKKNVLPLEEAKKIVRDELLTSVKLYKQWWKYNRPKNIPCFPERVYKDWVSWNDFLGTENKFGDIKSYRPFEDALAFMHKQGLKSYEEWREFCKEGKRPDDIPSRPDMHYSKWISWNHWLGNKPAQLLEVKKVLESNQIFYIIKEKNTPADNIFTFGVEETGYFGVLDRQKTEDFQIVKMFWYEKEKEEDIRRLIDHLSTPYYGEERKRIVPNIFNIIWYLQTMLREAKKPTGEKGELFHQK